MGRRFFVFAIMGIGLAILGGREEVLALGGKLEHPSIAVPTGDATAKKLHVALMDHKNLFAGGWFINSHSTLNFKGGARKLSRLLEDLCAVEGAEVAIRFSTSIGDDQPAFVKEKKPAEAGCQWSIDHNGWADAHRLTVTILLGEGGVDLEELELPTIHGRKPASTPEKVELPEEDR